MGISKLTLGALSEDDMESIVRKLNFSRLGNITWSIFFFFLVSVYWNDTKDPILGISMDNFFPIKYSTAHLTKQTSFWITNITRYQEFVFQNVISES